jgi:hypothetical protein
VFEGGANGCGRLTRTTNCQIDNEVNQAVSVMVTNRCQIHMPVFGS